MKNPEKGSRARRIGIYDLETGPTLRSSDPINFKTLQRDPQFLKLKVQAKFSAGRSNYSKIEKEILKEWILENGAEQMYEYFLNVVLKLQRDAHRTFIHSDLYYIFKEMGVEVR